MTRDRRRGAHAGLEYVVAVEPRAGNGDDRAVVVHVAAGVVIALADGAGGTSHGAAAAEMVVRAVEVAPHRDLETLLYDLDSQVSSGQTTAVFASVVEERVSGASVGDSGAWLIDGNFDAWLVDRDAGASLVDRDVVDLTARQVRKPLVGAGCMPVAFVGDFSSSATLLIASDGLLRYAKAIDIVRAVRRPSLEAAAHALIELVRLPSGRLQDDVSIVLCRQLR